MSTKIKILLAGFLFFGTILSILSFYLTIGLNFTPSMPQSVYIFNKRYSHVYNGDIVSFKLNIPNPYIPTDAKVIKKVFCKEGQYLTIEKTRISCDLITENIKQKDLDSKGRPLAPFNWQGVVPQGKFFAVAEHKDSFDSRYYGFIDLNKIIGVSIWSF